MAGWLKYYGEIQQVTHLIVFLGAELDKRRVNLLVDRPTHVRGNRVEKVDTGRTRGCSGE